LTLESPVELYGTAAQIMGNYAAQPPRATRAAVHPCDIRANPAVMWHGRTPADPPTRTTIAWPRI